MSLWAVSGVAQETVDNLAGFDWSIWRSSPADLLTDDRGVFQHRQPGLTEEEQVAYANLLEEISRQEQKLQVDHPANATALWETAFYEFEQARRRLWDRGVLQAESQGHAMEDQPANPFREAPRDAAATEAQLTSEPDSYSLLADIAASPEPFVGRPIVLRGRLQKESSEGVLLPDGHAAAALAHLTRGRLYDLNTDSPELLAHVDFVELLGDGEASSGIRLPAGRRSVPVLVKGWVIKLWNRRPLVYCHAVRVLGTQPSVARIRRHTESRQPLRKQESWLYYETLNDLELVPAGKQRKVARDFLIRRLDHLASDMQDQLQRDHDLLRQQREQGTISAGQHAARLRRLRYLQRQRERKSRAIARDLWKFDTYVDLFLHPEVWQGQMVSLKGYVRHVVSYPARHPAYPDRMLHELWLYTDDSQRNPAVIVTGTLPEYFPVEADVVNNVRITGCYFKPYVYRGQESRRVAPLILAADVQWNPDYEDVLQLAENGLIPPGSDLVQRARQQQPGELSGSALLLMCFGALVTLMILWGRAQQQRRDRRNLMNRINGAPEFDSTLSGDYSPRLSDYTAGYDL